MASDNTYLLKEESFDVSEDDDSDEEEEEEDEDELFNSSADIRHVKRWPPLGANTSSSPVNYCEEENMDDGYQSKEIKRLKRLEGEQEQLNRSLLSLTTHFAQVQFRLKQIVGAPMDVKETLLKELEEFAFKGIPDLSQCSKYKQVPKTSHDSDPEEHNSVILKQRQKQTELISQLKSQLEDLETYAYETGEASVPTSRVLEKQKVVIDQLRQKLSLHDLEHLDELSSEELRETIDRAIGQIVYPGKVKEKVIDQLKTQVTDLERFIKFLQDEQEGTTEGDDAKEDCTCPKHSKNGGVNHQKKGDNHQKNLKDQTLTLMRQAATLLQIFAITQFGCGSQKDFQRNLLKRTARANHWGDLRARLEMTISRLCELCQADVNNNNNNIINNNNNDNNNNKINNINNNDNNNNKNNINNKKASISDVDDDDTNKTNNNSENNNNNNNNINPNNNKNNTNNNETSNNNNNNNNNVGADDSSGGVGIHDDRVVVHRGLRKASKSVSFDEMVSDEHQLAVINLVRRELSVALRDLLQHGLVEFEQNQSMVLFGCFSTRNKQQNSSNNSGGGGGSGSHRMMHAWKLFMKYYEVKHGKAYSEAPARKLSMAYGLERVGGRVMSSKQTLLTAIEEVASSHKPFKRNDDSQFKAFVSLALNQKKLVTWLKVLLRSDWLIEYYYQPWSYVVQTGFDDALLSLDALTKLDFDLPTDLAIRPFQNMKDAF